MSDDDPFADLGETLDDDPEAADATDQKTSDADAEPAATTADPLAESAFSYEDAVQRPFYAREETISEFDSWLKYELERELSERGYQNIVVREMTDALLRTVVDEDLIDAVAQRFEQARKR